MCFTFVSSAPKSQAHTYSSTKGRSPSSLKDKAYQAGAQRQTYMLQAVQKPVPDQFPNSLEQKLCRELCGGRILRMALLN